MQIGGIFRWKADKHRLLAREDRLPELLNYALALLRTIDAVTHAHQHGKRDRCRA